MLLPFRKNLSVYGNQLKTNPKKIEWEKLNFKSKNEIKWEIFYENNIKPKGNKKQNNNSKKVNKGKEFLLTSFNRSLMANDSKFGPDISFLVPLGFKSSKNSKFDFSVRGWNRRPLNSKFLGWNSGDAVAQIYYQVFNSDKNSFGLNAGLRSVYSGQLSGGSTPIGEGSSLGFRWDHKLSNNSGFAIGAEQFIHFDNKTDTGRDIYFAYSKGKPLSKRNIYPILIFTGGIGTGYLALWDKTKFACSDLFGGAGVDVNIYNQLCWGPFFSLSSLYNEKFSTFFEYNNYSFMIGGSLVPHNNTRITFGITIAESFDDYKLKNFDELRWFTRISLSL